MPKNITSEAKWNEAKKLAAKEGHTDYDYIAALYKKLGGEFKSLPLDLIPFHALEEYKARTGGAKDKKKRKKRLTGSGAIAAGLIGGGSAAAGLAVGGPTGFMAGAVIGGAVGALVGAKVSEKKSILPLDLIGV